MRRADSPVAALSVVTANGVDLWVEQEGSGEDVLFISGLADEGACWVDQVDGLKATYRLTTFDNRGVGRSATPDGPFEIADFAADTIALMDALGLERPHVVGSSMGGAIAQELVLAHPERVRSLVLNGTWCRGDRFLHEVIRNWIWSAQKADSIGDFLLAVNLWCFAPRIWNDGTMDGWLQAAAESPHPQSVDAFSRSAEALIRHDSADRLSERTGAHADHGGRARSRAPRALLAGDRSSHRRDRGSPSSRRRVTSRSRSSRPTTTRSCASSGRRSDPTLAGRVGERRGARGPVSVAGRQCDRRGSSAPPPHLAP